MEPTPRSPSPTSGASESTDGDAAALRLDLEVGREHHGKSLFDCLDAAHGPLDRPRLRRACDRGEVLLNGEPAGPAVTLRQNDQITLLIPPESLSRTDPGEVEVLHRSGALVVAAKPAGIPFDASRSGGPSALGRLQELCDGSRPRAAHRLDRDTSGVIVAALDRGMSEQLATAFSDELARVHYWAVVRGPLPGEEGEIDVPLGKSRRSSPTLRPDPDHGRICATRWRVIERLSGFSVLELTPRRLGRSHQVRAHLAALGNPVLCDRDYREDDRLLLSQVKLHYRPKRGRPERPLLARPALHARRFVFGDLEVEMPLPGDLSVLITQLRRLRPLD